MKYEATKKVLYCDSCGQIDTHCKFSASVSEWGSAHIGPWGLEHDDTDSETNDITYRCGECESEWTRVSEFNKAKMTYAEALKSKMEQFGEDELSSVELDDYNTCHEPREGRNTMKCEG